MGPALGTFLMHNNDNECKNLRLSCDIIPQNNDILVSNWMLLHQFALLLSSFFSEEKKEMEHK